MVRVGVRACVHLRSWVQYCLQRTHWRATDQHSVSSGATAVLTAAPGKCRSEDMSEDAQSLVALTTHVPVPTTGRRSCLLRDTVSTR